MATTLFSGHRVLLRAPGYPIVGISFFGTAFSEPTLIRLASGFEAPVNYAVQTLKPFSFLAFSLSASPKIRLETPSFGDELVTSFHVPPTGAKPVVGVMGMLQQ